MDCGGIMSKCVRSITQHVKNYPRRDYLPALVVNPFPQPVRPRSDREIPSVTALVATRTDLPSQDSQEILDAEIIDLQYARPKLRCIPFYLRRIQISAYREAERLHPREEVRTSYLDVCV